MPALPISVDSNGPLHRRDAGARPVGTGSGAGSNRVVVPSPSLQPQVGTPPLYIVRLRASFGARYAANTQRIYESNAWSFLNTIGIKPVYTSDDVKHWVDGMIQAGMVDTSIRTKVASLKPMFDANDMAWPGSKLHLGLPQHEENAPAIPAEACELMIRMLGNKGGIVTTVLMLGTLFGLRTSEIQWVLAHGCDGKLLEIQTSKQGRRRIHHLPDGLGTGLVFKPTKLSAAALHRMFGMFQQAITRVPAEREGWHAVRRTLITALFNNGISEYEVHRWMGWRVVGKITFRYFRPEPGALDKRVWDAHPFLAIWQEVIDTARRQRLSA